ncbi:MAG: hypothetical protein IJ681_09860 [Bacteroidales bacterium]|nr:hypothetical protein [Bacteroidales bacterium]
MLEFLKQNKYNIIILLLSIVSFIPDTQLRCQTDELYDLQEPLAIENVDPKLYSPVPNRLTFELSTLNQENITLSWQNYFTKKTKTKWFVRLQYRLSENEDWKNVKDKRGNNVEFVTSQKRYPKSFERIILPEECNNKSFVQVSWLIDTYGNNKSGYPEIYFKKLNIHSEYDEFLGVPAEIKVYKNSDETKKQIGSIDFNKVPLPKIYPDNQRITIESKNVRDSVTLRITGTDASYFTASVSSIDTKTKLKTVTIGYFPKKEGKHKATLVINTTKLRQPVEIYLEGIAAKHVDYNNNLLPVNSIEGSNYSYNIPVFSNTDYQYRFSQEKDKFQKINIRYSWYRNETLLFSMYDTVRKNEYCAAIKSPSGATNLEVELSADKNIELSSYYFGSPKVKTMVKSGLWSDINNWQPKTLPNTEDFVVIDKGVTAKVDNDVACSMLILSDSANVSINTGKTFYISNDIFYGKNSWFTVHQYLLPSRWNYISSPVNQARAAVFSMKSLQHDNDTWFMQYNTGKRSKLDDYWSEYITDPKFALQPAKGYAVYTHEPMDVKYEGLLCSSAVTVPLVSTQEDRWNLVGNPYTAPLSSKKLFDDIDGKIQGNVIMLFDRQTKVYNPIIIDDKEEVMIPSLESFFVEALEQPSEITFKRSHQYIPRTAEQSWVNNNYLRLSVSKGRNWQYVLLGMDDDARKDFDEKDCHKMFGNNEQMPDIYLKDDDDEYSVCIFDNYPAIYDIGLYIGNSSDVEINLNNLSIMPDYVQIFIEDKETNVFHNVCNDNSINLFLNSGTTEKYRLHILKSIEFKDSKSALSGIFLWKDKDRLLFYSDGTNKTEKIKVVRNNETVFTDNVSDMAVFSKKLKKGKYKISFLMNGKWSEEINIEM